MELNENERLDDLQLKGLKLIQNVNGFCFGIDAVLLSDYAKCMKRKDTREAKTVCSAVWNSTRQGKRRLHIPQRRVRRRSYSPRQSSDTRRISCPFRISRARLGQSTARLSHHR